MIIFFFSSRAIILYICCLIFFIISLTQPDSNLSGISSWFDMLFFRKQEPGGSLEGDNTPVVFGQVLPLTCIRNIGTDQSQKL
jgi:hypothetical protein